MTETSDHTPLRSSNAAAIAAALWDSADFAGAASHYERALRADASDVEALHGLGRLKLAQNELAAAVLLLEQADHLAPSIPPQQRDELGRRIRWELAWALYRLDRFDLAAEQLASLPGQEALTAQLRAFGDRPPYRFSFPTEEIGLPFVGTFPLPIVVLSLAGKEYAFVIDTGAGQLVIDVSLQQELGLADYGSRMALFASGQSAPVGHTIVPEVRLGELVIEEVPAEVMEVRRFAPQISGFIGTSFLQRFNILCDFEGQLLRLRARGAPDFEGMEGMVEVPFWFFDDHLLLAPARLNDHETIAYLASGMAGGAFTAPESTLRQAALDRSDTAVEGVGVGGQSALESVRADRLCIGGWCREGMEGFGGFFPPQLEWRYGFRVGLLLAHEFLMGRRWAINFTQMKMHFE